MANYTADQAIALKIAVSTSASLSVLGSAFIIATYVLWPETRSNLRRLLVFLSLCDFVTASGINVEEERKKNGR